MFRHIVINVGELDLPYVTSCNSNVYKITRRDYDKCCNEYQELIENSDEIQIDENTYLTTHEIYPHLIEMIKDIKTASIISLCLVQKSDLSYVYNNDNFLAGYKLAKCVPIYKHFCPCCSNKSVAYEHILIMKEFDFIIEHGEIYHPKPSSKCDKFVQNQNIKLHPKIDNNNLPSELFLVARSSYKDLYNKLLNFNQCPLLQNTGISLLGIENLGVFEYENTKKDTNNFENYINPTIYYVKL